MLSTTIERQYEEDLASLQLTSSQSAVVVPGSTVEIVNLEKLEELTRRERPNGLSSQQSQTSISTRSIDTTDCSQTMVGAHSIATNTALWGRPLLDSKYIEVM